MSDPIRHMLKVASSSLINYQQIRNRLWANVRPITGWPRPHLRRKGKLYPEAHKYNWLPYLPEDGSYTIRPLPIFKMGGRDLVTGRVVVRTLGGGNPKKFRWCDMIRTANEDGSPREEKVLQLKYDPLRTPKLALVADSERMRWIPATDGVEVGDVIRTFSEIPRNPVRAKIGDAHPIGALPVGTKVHYVETVPGSGAKFVLSAGSSVEITKRALDGVTIKMHNNSYKLDRECMAVVGQLSNVGHKFVKLLCPQRKRWLGKRPRSGQWHRKDGYCGRKIRAPKHMDYTLAALKAKMEKQNQPDNFDLT